MAGMGLAGFRRCLLRSKEIASEPGMRATVVRVYSDTLKVQAQAFLDADNAVSKAKALLKEKNAEAALVLAEFDAPYREARSVIRAYLPHGVLPDTLQRQPTDTDKAVGIENLLGLLGDNSAAAWAKELMQGEIGQMALDTLAKVNAASAAGAMLAAARITRSTAFASAYERYLRFKRLVRDALGPKSRQYSRLHRRKGAAARKPAEHEVQIEPVRSPAVPAEPTAADAFDAAAASAASAAPAVSIATAASVVPVAPPVPDVSAAQAVLVASAAPAVVAASAAPARVRRVYGAVSSRTRPNSSQSIRVRLRPSLMTRRMPTRAPPILLPTRRAREHPAVAILGC